MLQHYHSIRTHKIQERICYKIQVQQKIFVVFTGNLLYTNYMFCIYGNEGITNKGTKEGIEVMALLQEWRTMAYDENADRNKLQQLWSVYFQQEKGIYAQLLKNPDEQVQGTVKELAERYGVSVMTMTGFLDGIDDSLVTPNPIEEMEEDTVVSLAFDKEKLYKNMIAADADWLYNLEEWDHIFTQDDRKKFYKEQKSSTTIVKEAKVYPNDPCPCGSGKKYKKCCGKK